METTKTTVGRHAGPRPPGLIERLQGVIRAGYRPKHRRFVAPWEMPR